MIKELVRNGVSTTTGQTYQSQTKNPMKKQLIFGNNSCQQMLNSVNNLNLKTNSFVSRIDLCQKPWFFVLLFCLASIAVFNLGITFWIINMLKLTDTGIGFGSFVLTKKGINIGNDIRFDGTLNAKLIKTLDTKHTMSFNSENNANILLKNNDYLDNSLALGDGKVEIQSNNFQIRSTNTQNRDKLTDILFNVDPNEITTYTKSYLLPTLGGHKIINSLETDSIRGHLYQDLRLESRTQKVVINGQKDIHLDSRGGDIMCQSYDDTVLTARDSIVFDTKRLEIKQMTKSHKFIDGLHIRDSYQLCVCESGRLFAVRPDSVCKTDVDWCLTTRLEGQQ